MLRIEYTSLSLSIEIVVGIFLDGRALLWLFFVELKAIFYASLDLKLRLTSASWRIYFTLSLTTS